MAMIIAFTVPDQWSMVMARERDRQTIFVMKQYARAISEWEKKHQALPASLDQMEKARNPRYVRGDGKIECPLTGKYEWIMVPPGAVQQNGQNPPGMQTPPGVTPPQTQTQPQTGTGLNFGPTPGQPGTGAGTGAQPGTGAPNANGFNAAASPKDYVGPFVGVRPPIKGKSFLALNGADEYSQWVYTIYDLRTEIQNQQNALATSK
ncbi:MAG TPA: hypothetical protein VFN10_04765 [Thermoanaerobaculia bacterium]|nr:hypothetical protein [Thermoanaerobaculia bacterium]